MSSVELTIVPEESFYSPAVLAFGLIMLEVSTKR